jgi:hypothetical protein
MGTSSLRELNFTLILALGFTIDTLKAPDPVRLNSRMPVGSVRSGFLDNGLTRGQIPDNHEPLPLRAPDAAVAVLVGEAALECQGLLSCRVSPTREDGFE